MSGKTSRLGKVAGELNVGMSNLVEFLAKNGHTIELSPNSKIEPEQFELLRKEFAADQNLKEQAKMTTVVREKRETISLRDKDEPEEIHEPVQESKPTPTPVSAPVVEAPTPTSAQEEVKETVKEPATPKADNESSDSNSGGLHVVGKIDLSSINSKTRPDKRKKDDSIAASKQVTKAEPVQPKPIETKKEEVKPVKEETHTEASQEIETIRVERKELKGPTVLGKIELPVEKPKSVGSSRPGDDRKKRKRIKTEGDKPAFNKQPNTGNTGNTGNKTGGHHNKQGGGNNFRKGPHPADRPQVSDQDIQKEVKETLARLSTQGGKSKASKNRRAKRDDRAQRREMEQMEAELQEKILKLTEFVTVSELAAMMNVSPTQVISACMSLGIFASINQRLDAETIQIVADEFGYETEFVSADVQEAIVQYEDKEEDLVARPPIITVMGHVDHGKTSLLDRIRNANIAAGEAGGITQHIGSYSVTLQDGRKLTFLDTPGHEAFTAMRARGAQITDVAIIIVAADDDVMPQTKEAISHAQAAGVPMVFAINKIDKPGANPDKIREQLSAMNILVEEWGGSFQCQEISAKQNLNIDALLDKVLLEADILDLKANPNKNAVGTVVESSLDKGKGYVTNMLVQAGTMRVGDVVLVGRNYGRVRAMTDEKGVHLKEAGPSQPVSILGINGAPSAGDSFYVMEDEHEAKSIATKREQLYREQGLRTTKHITLDEIGRRLAIGDFKELNVIVKGDVDGSIEALTDSLLKLSTEEIQVNIVHKGVGAITEADVNLASASDAIIIGFQVRPSAAARKLAEQEQIDIRLYSVIYKAIEELKSAMEGMLSPDIEEKVIGTAEIRETFEITKVGTIAGCFVTDGLIKRTSKVRVIRDGIVIHSGELGSLKRFKDDVKEVKNNYECGLNIEKFNDIKIGDIVEAYEEIEVARKL